MLYDRKSQSRAACLLGMALVNTVETLKNASLMLLWYAYAVVCHGYNSLVACTAHIYKHLSAWAVIFHGVFGKVVYHFVDVAAVCLNCNVAATDRKVYFQTLCLFGEIFGDLLCNS